MTGSSGGGQTTTTQSGPPPQVLQNYQNLTGAATNLVQNNPLALYGGSMVAGFTPAQQAGFSEVANSQGIGMPFLNAAGQEFGQATTPLYQTVQNYESPYTRDVTSALQNLFNQQNAQQQAQIQGNATSHGAYGGDREAVAQALAAQQENLAQAPTLAQTLQQGYQTGLSADEAQAWLASQAGFGIGALGPQAQSEALTGANALMGIGGLQQQLAQEQMNIPYQQFMAGQAYPYQSLGFLAPIVEGTGSLSGGTSSTTSPGPTALSQIGGLASVGAGLAGLFSGNSGSSSSFGGGSFIDPTTGLTFARGGRIGRAMGGGIGIPGAMKIPTGVPEVDLSYIPQGAPGGAVGGMLSPMQPDVTKTQTTSGGGGGIGLGDILSIGKFVAGLFAEGGRVGFDDGGTIPTDPTMQHRGIGLPPVPQISIDQIIKPGPEIKGAGPPKPPQAAASPSNSASDFSGIGSALKSVKGLFGSDTTSEGSSRGGGIGHYQSGGSSVPVQVAAQFGGANPAVQNQLAALQGLPIEKLQEMAVQYPPNTPQGQIVAMALAQRHAQPGSNQGNPQPQSGIGQQQQQPAGPQADTGYGGTAHAAGGSVSDGMGYVTEDELDPHPVVDHSGETVKIHYPSEGKMLDLGLPSISGRRGLAAGGASGSSTSAHAGSPNVQLAGGGNGWVGFAGGPGQAAPGQITLPSDFKLPGPGWTLSSGGAGDQYVTAPDGSITYLGQIPQGVPTALTSSGTWGPGGGTSPQPSTPTPSPSPAPSPSAPQLPPTPQVSTFGPSLQAANGVSIPQINPAAFSIQNLMNDPWTGQPYGSGQGNGNWFAPLPQWQPPGTNLPLGNVGGFPAYTPNLPSMSLIQGARKGGRIGYDDGGEIIPDYSGGLGTVLDTSMAGATTPTFGDEPIAPIETTPSEEPTLARASKERPAPKALPADKTTLVSGLGAPTSDLLEPLPPSPADLKQRIGDQTTAPDTVPPITANKTGFVQPAAGIGVEPPPDKGLAPGFVRGPNGLLTRNGQPPDFYTGGPHSQPAWQTSFTPNPNFVPRGTDTGEPTAPQAMVTPNRSPPSTAPDRVSNWETQNYNFAGMRIPGVNAGPEGGGFQKFNTPEEGVYAISHQLDRYASGATTGRPLTTLRGIVSTWAPPSENDTPALIARASKVTGFAPDQNLDMNDPGTKAKVIEAMIRGEQGGLLPVSSDVIARVAGDPTFVPAEHLTMQQPIGTAPSRAGIGTTNAPISDMPPQHEPPTGIGTDVGTRQGIGMVQQAINMRAGPDAQTQHHGLTLHDMAIPLLIAGLTTLSSRSPNAMAEGFRAAAPYFTAAERQETAQQVAEVRQAANAQTNQYKMEALTLNAEKAAQAAQIARDRLDETTRYHTDTLALHQQVADANAKFRETQMELAAARVETGLYASPVYGEGDDPDHPGQKTHGLWYAPKNPNSGQQPMFIPGVGAPKPLTGEAAVYDNLIKSGAAKDVPDAARVMAEAKRDPRTFEHSEAVAKMIGVEKANNPGVSEAQARHNVLSRLGIAGAAAPGAAQQPAATPPAAAPAQPAQAAPTAPQRPANLPEGSQYSPSRGQWRSPDGKIYDQNGQPVP